MQLSRILFYLFLYCPSWKNRFFRSQKTITNTAEQVQEAFRALHAHIYRNKASGRKRNSKKKKIPLVKHKSFTLIFNS